MLKQRWPVIFFAAKLWSTSKIDKLYQWCKACVLYTSVRVYRLSLFCSKLKIWKAKSASQIGASFYRMFANRAHVNESTSVVHVSSFLSDCSKFAVECDWNGKNSENVQNLGFFKKRWNFRWKILSFSKIAKCSKFTVECGWLSKISQNRQNFGFFERINGFSEKKFWIFSKSLKVASLL